MLFAAAAAMWAHMVSGKRAFIKRAVESASREFSAEQVVALVPGLGLRAGGFLLVVQAATGGGTTDALEAVVRAFKKEPTKACNACLLGTVPVWVCLPGLLRRSWSTSPQSLGIAGSVAYRSPLGRPPQLSTTWLREGHSRLSDALPPCCGSFCAYVALQVRSGVANPFVFVDMHKWLPYWATADSDGRCAVCGPSARLALLRVPRG